LNSPENPALAEVITACADATTGVKNGKDRIAILFSVDAAFASCINQYPDRNKCTIQTLATPLLA
jgi:hypothetical protein